MADPVLEFNFDSASLERIKKLWEWEKYLDPEMEFAMGTVVDMLQLDSEVFMWQNFMNPLGELEDSIQTEVVSPYEGQVWTDWPYAWRREEGFSGMTDSLGRLFSHDPGIHYFAETLKADKPAIRAEFRTATQIALDEMGA